MPEPRILTSYTDALGTERSSPQWAVDHVMDVLAEDRGAGGYEDVVRARAGEPAGDLTGRTLALEDGGEVRVADVVPHDLPLGYHRTDGDTGPVLVLHAPPRVPSAGARPGWVLAAQLYSARSEESWGHGDLRDARRLAEWVAAGGPGGHLMLNPLHAPLPGPHPQPSPYFASSRVYRNPMYLCVDEVAGDRQQEIAGWRAEARRLDEPRLIDRRHAWAAKRAALAALWEHERDDDAVTARVDRWLADRRNRDYAAFSVATEAGGGQPPSRGAAALRHDGPPRDDERFQAWLQVLLEDQLFAVGDTLIHDVAVGTDRAGADAWLWPDCYVLDGTRIGCPPDQFNTLGQDWGLPPLHPVGLRAAGYEPFVRAIRSAVDGAAGIRLDHVMGLERLFWIPEQGSPPDGVYVLYELEELLDIVAIEAHRADAFVVGEDLGTVPPSIPRALEERGMLSYRVMSLDPNHPSAFPAHSMAAITTHDLPTSVGLLSGRDLEVQRELDLHPNEDDTAAAVERLRGWVGAQDGDGEADLVVALHRLLGASPAHLATATLEDLALMVERPNMPGTIDEWPNWTWGLPRELGEVLASEVAVEVRKVLAGRVEAP